MTHFTRREMGSLFLLIQDNVLEHERQREMKRHFLPVKVRAHLTFVISHWDPNDYTFIHLFATLCFNKRLNQHNALPPILWWCTIWSHPPHRSPLQDLDIQLARRWHLCCSRTQHGSRLKRQRFSVCSCGQLLIHGDKRKDSNDTAARTLENVLYLNPHILK